MKCLKKIVFSLVISFGSILSVNGATNPYKEKISYGTNCTWYAWKMASEKAGVNLPGFGNAKDWYNDAKKAGYSVGTEPKDNSIIVWGGWTDYGHVGYVERVSGNILYVWDSSEYCFDPEEEEYASCMAEAYDEQSQYKCYAYAKTIACEYTIDPDVYGITGYIYLSEAPKKTNVNTNTNTDTNTDTKPKEEKTEIVKSNNAYLSNIVLSEGSIEFKKDTFEYNLEVENSVDKISVTGTLEDSKSSLTGNGEYNLEVGLNEVKLVVIAEDKTTKEYKINITRKDVEVEEKEEIKEEVQDNEVKDTPKENNKVKVLGVVAGASVLIVSGGIYLLKCKKSTKNS